MSGNFGNVTVYCCGGAGINIGSFFEQYRDRSEPGFSLLSTIYIDTSHSNINKNIPDEFTYIFDGLDGSGKVRKENAEAISISVLDILHKFKPGDLSIVISSASGGKLA